jgi:hypothetical protein
VPVAGLDELGVDRLLGLLVEAVVALRRHAEQARTVGPFTRHMRE